MSFRQRYILLLRTKYIDEKSQLLDEIPRRSLGRSVGMTFEIIYLLATINDIEPVFFIYGIQL